ncbi:DUF2384 domain-containing protein [Burkholderia sp. Bp8992]|nr:DUF2384 domain-containing protein [Burkholderia sp. Bp8992]
MVEHLPEPVWNRLVNLVRKMGDESGEPAGFDAKKWLCTWLHEEVPSLGWKKPATYLDTVEGEELEARTLLSMQTGAYR